MANAKETPRQKMINLMYLVLTCLLALNVSREVLQGFVHINESIETTNSNFTGSTQKILDAVEEAMNQGRHEFAPYYSRALQARQFTRKTFDYVDSLKRQLISYTEDKKGADTLKLGQVEKLDDYDRPTFFLLGSDEAHPKTGKYSASELRNKLVSFADSAEKLIDYMRNKDGLRLPEDDYQRLKQRISTFRPKSDYKDEEGQPLSWECKQFFNQPLAAVITGLSKIQSDIRNIEGEMVNTFASASGKLSVRFNQLQAQIVPVSQYIQSGSPFMADVFLSASSSDFKEDNLQFILGDVDTATGKVSKDAIVLPVERGTGKLRIPTNAVGHKDVKGWIKFRDGTGKYKYYAYKSEYIVANAAVAISPDKMNVFYAGVENPLTVSAAGVAPTELVVNIAGCGGRIQGGVNGKYSVKVSGSGTCTISVFQKLEGRLVQQGSPQVFRVKKFPTPPLRINGRTVIGNLDLKVAEAKNITALGLDIASFDFDAPFKVKQFVMTGFIPGNGIQSFDCEGNQLSPKAREFLSRLKIGSKIYFEDIKVQSPEDMREVTTVKVTVK